jgi:hypothetical protein
MNSNDQTIVSCRNGEQRGSMTAGQTAYPETIQGISSLSGLYSPARFLGSLSRGFLNN